MLLRVHSFFYLGLLAINKLYIVLLNLETTVNVWPVLLLLSDLRDRIVCLCFS